MTNPGIKFASLFCDWLESTIVSAFPKHDSPFLKGNFAPVQECGPHHNLPIVGNLPASLNGQLVYVAPNPKFKPVSRYHWADGDGMLHGVRIKNGTATYVSRYVKTSKLLQEERYGAAKFPKVGDFGGDWLGFLLVIVYVLRVHLGLLDESNGFGSGNTGLAYHNKRLMVLHEIDKPYVVQVSDDGNLQTVGRLDYDNKLSHSFTAHPKVDPVTGYAGEMFFFGYQLDVPSATYRVVSKDGVIQRPVLITLSSPAVMHDFAITENHVIFMDLPLTINMKNFAMGKSMFMFDLTKNARFGILPRYASEEHGIRWFQLPSCYVIHTANAWEDGDEVLLYASRIPEFSIDFETYRETYEENKTSYASELYEFRFNLRNGRASQKQLSQRVVEFPCINESYIGRKQRYIYTSLYDGPFMRSTGLAKFDLEKRPEEIMSSTYSYGHGRYGSHAVFVPKSQAKDIDEDEGYLVSFVYDEVSKKSEVVVVDAKTMYSNPVATIPLPQRVPYGFHPIFLHEEQLLESIVNLERETNR